ncbi:glycosyltransferase [Halorubrum sp. SS7]|nr:MULTISPECIES: glycosyltransferase [unclassified Halorubrum]TKX54824.1 glycosyltransferase [Halorubrum sp. SP3]TKX56273.1 glycosyltransferase [Halorubrum sp. SS7]
MDSTENDSKSFSIGLITQDRPSAIETVLNSLAQQTRTPDEIIVIDDSDDDRTGQIVSEANKTTFNELGVKVQYFQNSGGNQPVARNKILSICTGDILCFLDDDTFAPRKWLESLVETYKHHPDVDAIGGPALTADENLEVQQELLEVSENQNRYLKYGEVLDESDRWVPPSVTETEKFRGANMSFRVSALESVGGFDESYKGNGYREEDDVTVRLVQDGRLLLYNPEALVYHFISPEGGARHGDKRELEYWKGRNIVYFKRKNFADQYYVAVLRLFLWTSGEVPPVWRDVMMSRNSSVFSKIRGYLAEILDPRDPPK